MELLLPPEGDVVSEHPATLTNRIAAVIFLLLPGLGLIGIGTQLDIVNQQDADARNIVFVIGAVLAALGGLAFAQQNKSKAVLRADGVERWGLRGLLWAVRWPDAPELRYRTVKVRVGGLLGLIIDRWLGHNVHITLVDSAGAAHKLPINLKGMEVLAERIVEKQTSTHYPEAKKKIDAGEEVRFGKAIVLDKEKISTRKLFGGLKSCPLGEIEKVSVDAGVLSVRQKGKMFAFTSAAVGAVPNVFLLLKLLDSLLGVQTPPKGQQDFAGGGLAS